MINSYVALDLETTGLHPLRDEILEIGAVKVIDGEVVETYQTLVKCESRINANIQKLTGITEEMAAGGIDMLSAMNEITEFCENHILLGHNIQFDFSFLKAKSVQAKRKFAARGIDTLRIARKVLPDLEKRSLEYLCTYYKIEADISHRALEDAYSAMKLYQIFQNEFGIQQELFEPMELLYKVKKEASITPAQKGYLNDLVKYHTIELKAELNSMTKSEASRMIDAIILEYGRIPRFHSGFLT